MSDWQPKRFWKQTTATPTDGGYTVLLDGRHVKTPGKAPLTMPTMAMAEAVAMEWDAQQDKVDPRTMPVTRSANSAIDKVSTQRDEVIAHLAEYADSDLLCYRASEPQGLVARQNAGWDPVLDWAATQLNARLAVGVGVMYQPQNADDLSRLQAEIKDLDAFALTAAHDLISLSGSFVLAVAVVREHLNPEVAWELSRIDEQWQLEQWGNDEEAESNARLKQDDFLHAARFYGLSQQV
ncbi:ATP12 family chaperone protein [Yoonia sediminilitoris]|uniref:Chaperone required for assembly of F1-ATPase n=1 Tax=Yoonia sediminilitoris TaxID=1286148 RepID=A0A2T6KPD2_9RHOB|nr:ATP12 family protein [Yoonia sediminilitoris]PUB18423.1 chaperone required for assembly of F1-ATPase [Yoonia sediminilitoris]RCW98591.1 chaperone required for assembly of F1-ATPase [Yoonia sediminilitoris]